MTPPAWLTELLATSYYNNTIETWAKALAIVIGAFVVARMVYWFTNEVVKRWAAGTETQLDDILIDMIEEPIVVVITLFGLRVGMHTLTMTDTAQRWVEAGWQVGGALTVAWLVTRVSDALHDAYLKPWAKSTETDLDDVLLPIFKNGVKFMSWTLGLVVGLSNAGYDIFAVLASLGIGGLALALAAQDTVANLFGGLTVMWFRPFVVGDWIQVGDVEGEAETIDLRSSKIRTMEGKVVIVPNKNFTEQPVINYASRPKYIMQDTFFLQLDTPADKLERLLQAIPEALASLTELADRAVVGLDGVERDAFRLLILFNSKLETPDEGFPAGRHKRLDTRTKVQLAVRRVIDQHEVKLALPTTQFYDPTRQ